MRFFSAASAVLAFAASAFAQTADFDPIYSPAEGQVVPAGQPWKVTWSAPAKYQSGTISISLIGGADANTLVPIGTIASGVKNSDLSYTWNVDATLGDKAAYGLVFRWEADTSIFQYSQRFAIKGGVVASSSASSVVATASVPVVTATASGVKTVTLTSCPPDAVTSSSNGTAPTWTTKVWNTTVVAPTYIPTGALPTTTKAGSGKPTGSSAPIPTAAAPHVGAGIVAVFGGVAAALLL